MLQTRSKILKDSRIFSTFAVPDADKARQF
jgi:hypothetical protein